jgi:hypothetical protein
MLLLMRGAPREVTAGLCELDQLDIRMRPRPRAQSGRVTIPTQHILDAPLVVEGIGLSKAYHVANPGLLEGPREQAAPGDGCRGLDPAQSPAFAAANQAEARLAANALTAIKRALRSEQPGFQLSCTSDYACAHLLPTVGHASLERVDRGCERSLPATTSDEPRCLTLTFRPPRNPPSTVQDIILFVQVGPQARPGAATIERVTVSFFVPAVV